MRVLCALLLLGGAAIAADNDAETKALAGTWRIAAAILDGRDHLEDFEGMSLVLRGNEFHVQLPGIKDSGTFTIEPSKSPKWIDIKTGAKGPFMGKTLPGIYKLDGDTLTVCCQADAKARPTAFEARAKTRNMLLTYQREKKK